MAGSGEVKTARARPGFPALRSNPLPSSSIDRELVRHPFLSLDDSRRVAIVRKGQWNVDGDLVIPRGLALRVEAGTTLRFEPSAALVVYGRTDLRGRESEPIVLEPGSPDEGWQGVVVHEASQRSQWSHVTVRGTTGVVRGAWNLTGGVTFYRSDITMSHCTLSGNRAEDALNIIHSDFVLEDLTAVDTVSDAFDSDFSRGRVVRGVFRDIGKSTGSDAVDFSGSTVSVEHTRFTNVTDKAISVGEGSELSVSGVVIENCGVGVVSKDGSVLQLAGAEIRGARVAGLMTYTKKPEYGPARLVAKDVRTEGTERHALAQDGSSLVLDGNAIPGQGLDVDELYRTVMKPGRRQ
jgi:hypothetical protein